ncbi:gliding motility-associated C-terminal domain-containing protein [Saprospiraceae bacterium]|nr:gliding motility-associated C-terminal domain-containing protein [Saprospiraceae bacterium]
MNYPKILGIFLLFLLPYFSLAYGDTNVSDDLNLTVDCGPMSGTFTLDCINKIPEIPIEFTNNITILDLDKTRFELLGGVITNECNPVVITANDVIIGDDPADCMDDFTVVRTYTISDQVTEVTCVTTYEIMYVVPRILSNPQPRIVDCSENVDSIFALWLEDFGGTTFQGCGNIVSVTPPSPVIAFEPTCIVNPDPTSGNEPNERGRVRVLWELNDACIIDTIKAIASFVVVDNTAPTLICPDDRSYNIEEPDLFQDIEDYLDTAEAFEQCGDARIENNFTMSSIQINCEDVQEITVFITARDTCNNFSFCETVISIVNEAEADIVCPDDITIECGDSNNRAIINNWAVGAQARDFRNMALQVTNNFDTLLLNAPFCGQTTEITFSATFCDRISSCAANVTIVDTQNPVITCPSDTVFLTSEPDIISAATLWTEQFNSVDACGSTTDENNLDTDELLFSCDPTKDILVEFIAEDICQNDTSCVSIITIESDYQSNISCGDTLELQCGDANNITLIQDWIATSKATDNINSVLVIDTDLNIFDPRLISCNGVIPVTFTAEDRCTDILSCTTTIMMMDSIAPTLTCPSDIVFDAGVTDLNGDIDNWLASTVATDNCAPPIEDNNYDPSDIQGCDLSVTLDIEFSAMDSCGLQATPCTSRLTINTDRLPTIICADRLLVDCNGIDNNTLVSAWLGSTIGTDFNGNDLAVTTDYIPGALEFNQCIDSIDVQFNIIDNCLYEDSCVARIIVADTIAPTIICPIPLNINNTQDDYQIVIENWLLEVSADDQCMPGVPMTDFDLATFSVCDADEITEVIFTVSDGCNNTSSCTAIINVNKVNPTIICPTADLSLQCGDPGNDVMIEDWLAQASALDNNDVIIVVSSDFDSDNLLGDCSISSTITFEAQDMCGQITNCIQTISLVDDLGPTIACPAELNLSAGAPDIVQTVEDFLDAIPIDDCNSFTINDDLDRSLLDFMCGDELIIPVIVTAVDSCSNTSNCAFDITIRNSVVSAITCAQDTTIECGFIDNAINLTGWLETATAFDSDGNQFLVTNDLDVNDAALLDCAGTRSVLFTMMDNCNTPLTCNAVITITDTTVPEIDCPSDTLFVLGTPTFDGDITAWLSTVNASDNCAMVGTDDNYDSNFVIDDCDGFIDLPVTFTAQDDCGLTSDCVSTLTIRSDRAPIINCPSELVVECGNANNIPDIEAWRLSADGFDFDGTELDVTSPGYSEVDFFNLNCNESLLVTFVTTNSCGNPISCESMITLEDVTPPELSCPEDLTINSTDPDGEAEITAWLATAISMDACSNVSVTFDMTLDFSDLCQASDLVEVPYESVDECGLVSNCTSVIFINKEEPVITCPSDPLRLECGDAGVNAAITIWLDSASAIDNSETDVLVSNDFITLDISDICTTSENDVTFSVTDDCNQVTTCVQTISILDTQAPSITCPNDIDVDIFSATITTEVSGWIASLQADDACSAVISGNDFSADLNNLDCGEPFQVLFTAEDECNNISDCTATITFSNNLMPTIDCPDPITIKCSEVTTTTSIDSFLMAFTVDSQDEFDVINDFNINNATSGCTQSFTDIITFTITDACNNTNNCEASISFLPDGQMYIPNAFSPDGDGRNDYFTVFGNESIANIRSMQIYDRWGNLVFEASDIPPNEEREGWDGFFRNDRVDANVYVYKVEVEDSFGNLFLETGSITVVR